jgi:hypothetical protein
VEEVKAGSGDGEGIKDRRMKAQEVRKGSGGRKTNGREVMGGRK